MTQLTPPHTVSLRATRISEVRLQPSPPKPQLTSPQQSPRAAPPLARLHGLCPRPCLPPRPTTRPQHCPLPRALQALPRPHATRSFHPRSFLPLRTRRRCTDSVQLYPTYQASLAQLPRALRHLLPPLSSPAFTPLSIPTSPASPPVDDELGSIVSRSQPGAGSVSTGTGSGGGASAEVIIPECEVTGLRKAGIAVRLEARADLGEGGEAAEGAKGSAGIGVLDREEGGKSGKGGKREEGGGRDRKSVV